jgi:hypothetical protein
MLKRYYKFLLHEEATGESGGGTGEMTQEEIAARLSVSEGAYKEDEEEEKGEVKPDKPADKPADLSYVASPIWDVLKTDEGFVMPEGITAENEQELMKPFLAKKYGFEEPVLHPLAKQIQDLSKSNPNLTINDLVNEVSNEFVDASKMTIDQKISFDLYARYGEYDKEKNPDGLTPEDISEYISKMTKIEKQELAKAIEHNINEYNKKKTEEYEETNKVKFEEEYNKVVDSTKKAISDLKIELSKVDSVFGISVSQDDHAKFLEEFERVVIPDKLTGQRGLDSILSNDLLLYKAYLIMAKFGEEKVIEVMTKGRESAKEELLKKLEITPNFAGGNTREYLSGKDVDYAEAAKLLSIPQR